MNISWTDKAVKQLDKIFEYIAADSTLYAYRTIEKIIDQVESVAHHPHKGRVVPEYERKDIREVFHHPYRIIYLIRESNHRIEILSVIHGARLLKDRK